MKRTKRYILTVISFIVNISVYAYTVEIDGIYYNLIDKGRIAEVTTNPNKYSGDIIIPANVEYDGYTYGVTSIGVRAFYFCEGLKSVSIPNSVIAIGDEAFLMCSGLTSVEIPNSVTSIGNSAFNSCGLISVFIPDSVTIIGANAFFGCRSLESVSIPNSLTSIAFSAFAYCI